MNNNIKQFYELTKVSFAKDSTSNGSCVTMAKRQYFKIYPRFPSMPITDYLEIGEMENRLQRIKITQNFSSLPISFEQLSHLLYFSCGTTPTKIGNNEYGRTYNSTGYVFPIELYFYVNNVSNLEQGLYHFAVKTNNIECIYEANLTSKFNQIIDNQCELPAIVIILTSILNRSEVKGINGYRLSLLECGYISQNIALLSEKLNLGIYTVDFFDNDKLSKLLDITKEEIPLNLILVGNKDISI